MSHDLPQYDENTVEPSHWSAHNQVDQKNYNELNLNFVHN